MSMCKLCKRGDDDFVYPECMTCDDDYSNLTSKHDDTIKQLESELSAAKEEIERLRMAMNK